MNFQEIWVVAEPYVIKAVELIIAAGAMVGGSLAVFRRADKRIGFKLNEKTLSKSVANELIGSTLNIDLTAITEKAFKKIEERLADMLDKRLAGIEQSLHSNTVATCGTAELLVRARELSKEGREEILSEIAQAKGISAAKQEQPKEVITLNLDIAKPLDSKEKEQSGISFV